MFNFSIALSFSSKNVNAQQMFGWCIKTKDGKTCQQTYGNNCDDSVYRDRPSDCRLISCVLKDGNCQHNVPYKTCIEEFGGKEGSQQTCALGCCGIAGRAYGIKTREECNRLAANKGYNISYVEFYEGLTNERECALKFSGKDRGCCVSQTGACSYGYREECLGTFHENVFCSDIDACAVISHFKLDCGKMNGDEDKICWFDNVGNQEECIYECNYPAFTCRVNNIENYKLKKGEVGFVKEGNSYKEIKENNQLPLFAPYCKSTSCNLSGAKGSLELEWEKSVLHTRLESPPPELYSGHSICYNFYTVENKEEDTFGKRGFPARSTGLQNQILRCINGEISIEGLGPDRELLCFNANNFSTYVEENRWEECWKCGGKGLMDRVIDFFRAGNQFAPGFGSIISSLKKGCDEKECEEGKYSNGESYCIFRSEVRFYIAEIKGSKLFSGEVDPACVPRYPPGTTETCERCGKFSFFDECEKSEAYAWGNCQFESYSVGKKTLTFLLDSILLYLTIKFNLIPWYTFADAIVTCAQKGLPFPFIACLFAAWIKYMIEETKEFIENIFGLSIILKLPKFKDLVDLMKDVAKKLPPK